MGSKYLDTVLAAIEVGRPVNALMGVAALLLGSSIVVGGFPSFIPFSSLASIVVGGFLIVFSIMVVNDIVDLEADRVNVPWRPLPSGRLGVGLAWRLALAYALLGVAVTFLVEPMPETTLIALWFLALAHFYNFMGKRVLIAGNVIVAFLTAFPLVYGVFIARHYLGPLWGFDDYLRVSIFWAMVFLSVLGREVAKGIVDVEGDRAVGAKTIANTYGESKAASLSSSLYAASIALSLLPPVLGLVNAWYIAIILPVDAMVAVEAARLVRSPTRDTALSHKKRVLALMSISMVGLLVGSMEI
ncbi:MAG: geranylgeranylglycerol-phosphate geranylgeranyltransferase [Thermoprotei archaeon]|nr:geranylgeranylglycerol-phosphate geranylgeranyltransferase [Thermoprotei archaeon]